MKSENLPSSKIPWWQSKEPVKMPPELLIEMLGDIFSETHQAEVDTTDTDAPTVDTVDNVSDE